MNSVIFKDCVFAIFWLIIRGGPLWLYYVTVTHIREDRFVTGLMLFSIIFCVVYGLILYISNSWPALFWRYGSRLETRVVYVEHRELHQVKIFGTWYFINIGGGSADLSLKTTWSPVHFMEINNFESKFLKFINAHREEQDPNVRSSQTYIRGEKSKR